MAKRKGLGGVLGLAAQAKEQAGYTDDYLTTAIHIPRETHKLLRAVAFRRAQSTGGRASVSAVITALVEEQRDVLTSEAGSFLE
jgi:hypothetical protein